MHIKHWVALGGVAAAALALSGWTTAPTDLAAPAHAHPPTAASTPHNPSHGPPGRFVAAQSGEK